VLIVEDELGIVELLHEPMPDADALRYRCAGPTPIAAVRRAVNMQGGSE
jgi:hypothetical protein